MRPKLEVWRPSLAEWSQRSPLRCSPHSSSAVTSTGGLGGGVHPADTGSEALHGQHLEEPPASSRQTPHGQPLCRGGGPFDPTLENPCHPAPSSPSWFSILNLPGNSDLDICSQGQAVPCTGAPHQGNSPVHPTQDTATRKGQFFPVCTSCKNRSIQPARSSILSHHLPLICPSAGWQSCS